MNKNKHYLLICLLLSSASLISQNVNGNLKLLSNQEIKLFGFTGQNSYEISSTLIDEKGNFHLTYSMSDIGIGYLQSIEEKPFFIILSGEDIEISGQTLNHNETMKIIKGLENQYYYKYTKEYARRQQAFSAWTYLENLYNSDSTFTFQKTPIKLIRDEKKRIKSEDSVFMAEIPSESYISWFINLRKLLRTVNNIPQNQPKEIPNTISIFRAFDYSNNRFYKSGLFKDVIESHFWLIENSGHPLEKVWEEMKTSIDLMFENLVENEKAFNEATDCLFDFLERHSLFQVSEYLALKVLNQTNCIIDDNLAKQLETYSVMKKGNIAPDIVFEKSNFVSLNKTFLKLSEIKSKYIVVVFGGSWCPKCNEELPKLAKFYDNWLSKDVEVVLIALEDENSEFISFSKSFPFPSYSDGKKWGSKIVNDYYVFSTPTMFLLNDKLEIILRPASVRQLAAWIDWNLN